MQTLITAFEWVKQNPMACVEWIIVAWTIANIVWAQWPKPKSPQAEAVWRAVHHVLQLIATTAKGAGTFTWPSLLRLLIGQALKAPDPFHVPEHTPSDPNATPKPGGV